MSVLTRALPLVFCAAFGGPAFADDLCSDGDFEAFLARFGHEITVQEAATADPLIVEMLDPTAEPEPALMRHVVPLAEVTWPVIPDTTRLEGRGLELQISDLGDKKAVLLRGTDSGERITFYFARQPCWTLTGILDESM